MLHVIVGLAGSGKTTHCASVVKKCIKKNIPVYSNVEIMGAFKIQKSDLGVFRLEKCVVIIDEAGLDFNNRDFKNLENSFLYFLKMHRHYKCELYFYSQANDMDIKIRQMANRYWLLEWSYLRVFNIYVAKRVKPVITITKNEGEIKQGFAFTFPIPFVTRKYYYAPKYWHMFDSWECKPLVNKNFKLYAEYKKNMVSDLKFNTLIISWILALFSLLLHPFLFPISFVLRWLFFKFNKKIYIT